MPRIWVNGRGGGGGPPSSSLDVTVNDDAVTSSGLLPVNVPRVPIQPVAGAIIPPQPVPFGVVADTENIISMPFYTGEVYLGCVGPDGNTWGYSAPGAGFDAWQVTPEGVATSYELGEDAEPFGICCGPDGRLWLGDISGTPQVWAITTGGTPTSYSAPAGAGPGFPCVGADGNIYFADQNNPAIYQVTPEGVFTTYTIPNENSLVGDIVAGPDGNLWMTDYGLGTTVWKMTTGGSFTAVFTGGTAVDNLCVGPDSNLWVTDGEVAIYRITPEGSATTFSTALNVTNIVTGPDSNLYSPVPSSTTLAQITLLGGISEITLPFDTTSGTLCIGPDGAIWISAAELVVSVPALYGFMVMPMVLQVSELDTTQVTKALEATQNDGPLITLPGLLSVNAQRHPIVPSTGILPPQPSIFGFEFNGLIQNTIPTGGGTNLAACCVGSDHNLWICDYANSAVIRLTPLGVATSFTLTSSEPNAICTGSDGNLWVADNTGAVWKVTTAGSGTKFTLPAGGTATTEVICCAADGNLWVGGEDAPDNDGVLWRVTTAGSIDEFTDLGGSITALPAMTGLCMGPDGALWFSVYDYGLWRLPLTPTPSPGVVATNPYPSITPGTSPPGYYGLCTGPDGNLWSNVITVGGPGSPTEGTQEVLRLTPEGVSTLFDLPSQTLPTYIVSGGGGDLWSLDISSGTPSLLKITTNGVVTSFTLAHQPTAFCIGPDGSFWITESSNVVVCPFTLQFGQYTGRNLARTSAASGPGATPTMNTDNFDFFDFTALATAITSMTTNLSGTPANGDRLHIAFTDNGTARAIAWGSSFESSGTSTLPLTTVISTRLDVYLTWNTVTSKWRCQLVT